MAAPPPFVGRHDELAMLGQALEDRRVLVVRGAVGAGKTRLARHVAARVARAGAMAPGRDQAGGLSQAVYVRCEPRDRGVAVRARAERILDILPGDLPRTLRQDACLLVIDDLHHLAEDDAARLLADLVPDSADRGRGRLLALTAQAPPLRRDQGTFVMDLAGLDETAARDLWHHLEATCGPTRHHACDQALPRTRGMPLALRREYARAAFGDDAWTLDALPADARSALEVVAVLGLPAAPAAVVALAPETPTETALLELVSRQLVDPTDDGRFSMHEGVRARVLDAMEPARRQRLAREAAGLVAAAGMAPAAHRSAWAAGDDSALGLIDPVDRMRAEIGHLVAAGDVAEAAGRLSARREILVRRGGCGELLGLVDLLDEHADAATATVLRALRAGIAVRQGQVARAIELDACGDAVTGAVLRYRAGDADQARARLEALGRGEDADLRGRAAAALCEIELARGDLVAARDAAITAFERDSAAVADRTRALLHLALAAVEEHAGRLDAARAALCRAASSGRLDPELGARIEARQAMCLAREGRLGEAEAALVAAERAARAVDAVAVTDEVRMGRSLVALRRGQVRQAAETLHALLAEHRQRGDEIGALRVEIALARALLLRGDMVRAAELAAACQGSALRRGLHGLAAAAALVDAAIDAAEMRLERAQDRLARLATAPVAEAGARAEAALLLSLVQAQAGAAPDGSTPAEGGASTPDSAGLGAHRLLVQAQLALAQGEPAEALRRARDAAVRAERTGCRADLAEALTLIARLALGQGDRPGAAAAAARAEAEAEACGMDRARAVALLVLAALAMERSRADEAAAHARAAAALAAGAGLAIEHLVAVEALDTISLQAPGQAAGPGARAGGGTATMTPAAIAAAARLTAELGLVAARPYCVISASGQPSYVADACPERLRMAARSLAIDGVREIIVRDGAQVADLRRRSLLKRLLFLFARAPGRVFSKEEIVEQVWSLEYHPLRHDAALFTNIMRVRRLLGEDGADLVRVSDDGYRFMAPADYLYIEPAARS